MGTEAEGGRRVSTGEAALLLKVSERTINNWIKSGRLESGKANGKRWVAIPQGAEVSEETFRSLSEVSESAEPLQKEEELASEAVSEPSSPMVPMEVYNTLLYRHEEATVRLGYLQAQVDEVKALKASEEELRAKAAMQEERLRIEAEARHTQVKALTETAEELQQKALQADVERQRAEEEAEKLKRELEATKAALDTEKGRGLWSRLFGR